MSSDDSGQPRRLNYVSVPTRQFIFSTNVPRWILLLVGALVIGTFDILFAIIFWYLRAHVAPSRIFQSVAAGLYGKASFTGGARTALVVGVRRLGVGAGSSAKTGGARSKSSIVSATAGAVGGSHTDRGSTG